MKSLCKNRHMKWKPISFFYCRLFRKSEQAKYKFYTYIILKKNIRNQSKTKKHVFRSFRISHICAAFPLLIPLPACYLPRKFKKKKKKLNTKWSKRLTKYEYEKKNQFSHFSLGFRELLCAVVFLLINFSFILWVVYQF